MKNLNLSEATIFVLSLVTFIALVAIGAIILNYFTQENIFVFASILAIPKSKINQLSIFADYIPFYQVRANSKVLFETPYFYKALEVQKEYDAKLEKEYEQKLYSFLFDLDNNDIQPELIETKIVSV